MRKYFSTALLVSAVAFTSLVASGQDKKSAPKEPETVSLSKDDVAPVKEVTNRIEKLQLEGRALRAEVQLGLARIEKIDAEIKSATQEGAGKFAEIVKGKGITDLSKYEVADAEGGGVTITKKKE